jgi:glucosamine-6-phosphate deaminase
MKDFIFSPSTFIPFRDKAVVERLRALTREQLTEHANPDYRIQILPDAEVEPCWMADILARIRHSSETGEKLVMIMPNPWPNYVKVAEMINNEKLSCRNIHTFNMDEYANEHGEIAPESWPLGFGHAFKKYFYSELAADLRPPEEQVHGLSNENIDHYSRLLEDLGGADICYAGPGWSGHIAFIEPDAPEFAAASLEDWKKMGARVCTLSPLTIAQNSLHGCFGASGDLTAVPPKAATIGPADAIAAKHRIAMHSISIGGSFQSWQRLTTRLCLHGPVTPLVPESVFQTLPTDVWVSETSAQDIKVRWDLGY